MSNEEFGYVKHSIRPGQVYVPNGGGGNGSGVWMIIIGVVLATLLVHSQEGNIHSTKSTTKIQRSK
jgi:hypothetical protein